MHSLAFESQYVVRILALMTPQKSPKNTLSLLKQATTEEEVKSIIAQHLSIKYDTKANFDLYTEQVLFEFKADRNLKSNRLCAQTLAQALYYVRRLNYGFIEPGVDGYFINPKLNLVGE
jgi:hypothetical protein